jgi:hypothetical protein
MLVRRGWFGFKADLGFKQPDLDSIRLMIFENEQLMGRTKAYHGLPLTAA